jgi:hypothetical protein
VQNSRTTAASLGGLRRGTIAALVVAGALGVLLLIAAFVVPVYESATFTSSGDAGGAVTQVTSGSATLVGENGWIVVLLLAIPLAATAVVGYALARRPPPRASAVPWTATGLHAALTLLRMLAIGIVLRPITAALVVACLNETRRETLVPAVVPHGA